MQTVGNGRMVGATSKRTHARARACHNTTCKLLLAKFRICLNTAEKEQIKIQEFGKRCPQVTASYGRAVADSQNFWRLRTLFCRSNRPSSAPCVAVFISGSVCPSNPFERELSFASPSKRAAESQNFWRLSNTDAPVCVHRWAVSPALRSRSSEREKKLSPNRPAVSP